jgi:hypothetical protein
LKDTVALIIGGGRRIGAAVATWLAFFASDDASLIAGQTLSRDCGLFGHQPFYTDMTEGSNHTA